MYGMKARIAFLSLLLVAAVSLVVICDLLVFRTGCREGGVVEWAQVALVLACVTLVGVRPFRRTAYRLRYALLTLTLVTLLFHELSYFLVATSVYDAWWTVLSSVAYGAVLMSLRGRYGCMCRPWRLPLAGLAILLVAESLGGCAPSDGKTAWLTGEEGLELFGYAILTLGVVRLVRDEDARRHDPNAVYLFVLWDYARVRETDILSDLSARFKVLKQFEVAWPIQDFLAHLVTFYGFSSPMLRQKIRRSGAGRFLAVLVEDAAPEFRERRNLRGILKNVNVHIHDAKLAWRAALHSKDIVHASETEAETRQNVAQLLGCTLDDVLARPDLDGGAEILQTAPPPHTPWRDAGQFFRILGECLPYERLDAGAPGTAEEPWEIRLPFPDRFPYATGALKEKSDPDDPAWLLPVGRALVHVNVRGPEGARKKNRIRRYVDVRLTLHTMRLWFLTGTGLSNLFRFEFRLGGLFRVDFCLGAPMEIVT